MTNISKKRKNKWQNKRKKLNKSRIPPEEKLQQKKSRFKKNTRDNIIITSIVIFILVIILYFWYPLSGETTDKGGLKNSILNNPDDYVIIPIDSLEDREIHYYETSGVKYYAHKNPWGQVRTRISLCEQCTTTSFRLENNGKNVGCNACLTQWDSDLYEKIYFSSDKNKGCGCENNPLTPLSNTIIDNYVVINKADLLMYKES